MLLFTGGSALGVVVLADDEIRCALTTVEGLTLFEARTSREAPTDGDIHDAPGPQAELRHESPVLHG